MPIALMPYVPAEHRSHCILGNLWLYFHVKTNYYIVYPDGRRQQVKATYVYIYAMSCDFNSMAILSCDIQIIILIHTSKSVNLTSGSVACATFIEGKDDKRRL